MIEDEDGVGANSHGTARVSMGLLGVAGRLGLDFGGFMDDVPV